MDTNSINGIGNCFFRLEKYTESIRWYKKAIKADRYCKHAYNGLGNAFDIIGDHK